MPFADAYTFRARVQPAFMVILPLLIFLFALLPELPLFVSALVGLLGAAGGTAVMAQVGGSWAAGRSLISGRVGDGPPTTRLLRHRRTLGDIKLGAGLREQFEQWIKHSLPTEREEENFPERADVQYGEAVRALRDATRDQTRFGLVFAENVKLRIQAQPVGYEARRGIHCGGTGFVLLASAGADRMGTSLARPVLGRFDSPGSCRGSSANRCGREHWGCCHLANFGETVVGEGNGRCVCTQAFGVRPDAERDIVSVVIGFVSWSPVCPRGLPTNRLPRVVGKIEDEFLASTDASQVGVVSVMPPALGVRVVGQGRLVAVRIEPPWQAPIRHARAVGVGQDQPSVEPAKYSPSRDFALVVTAQVQPV